MLKHDGFGCQQWKNTIVPVAQAYRRFHNHLNPRILDLLNPPRNEDLICNTNLGKMPEILMFELLKGASCP